MKKSAKTLLLRQSLELMAKITSLADEIRQRIAQPEPIVKAEPKPKTKKGAVAEAEIMQLLRAFDNSGHKSLVHVRFDAQTVKTLNHFKMATGVDLTKLVAFAVRQLFDQHPELREVIKQFIQNMS